MRFIFSRLFYVLSLFHACRHLSYKYTTYVEKPNFSPLIIYPIVLRLRTMKPYSQTKAMFAITRASLRAIFRSPSAVIFGFGFPLIFILVFGFIGGSGVTVRIALKNLNDTNNL